MKEQVGERRVKEGEGGGRGRRREGRRWPNRGERYLDSPYVLYEWQPAGLGRRRVQLTSDRRIACA